MIETGFQTTPKPLCRKNIVILALCESSCGYIGLTFDTKRKSKAAQKTGRGKIEISDDLHHAFAHYPSSFTVAQMAAVKPVDIRYRLFIIRPQIDFQIGKPYQHHVFLFRHCAADFPAAAQMRDEFVQLPQGVFVGGVLSVFCHMDSVSHRQ